MALRWLTSHISTAIYASVAEVEAIHGHNGKTKLTRPAPAANTEGLRAIRIDRYDPACSLCREQAGRPNANTGDFLCNEHARVIGRAALRGEPSTAPTSEHRCPHGHAMELQWVCETCGERADAPTSQGVRERRFAETIIPYTRHMAGCERLSQASNPECDCGLDKAIAALQSPDRRKGR